MKISLQAKYRNITFEQMFEYLLLLSFSVLLVGRYMDIICDVISYSSVCRCSICVNTMAISLPKLYQGASQGKRQGRRNKVRGVLMGDGGIQAPATCQNCNFQ